MKICSDGRVTFTSKLKVIIDEYTGIRTQCKVRTVRDRSFVTTSVLLFRVSSGGESVVSM